MAGGVSGKMFIDVQSYKLSVTKKRNPRKDRAKDAGCYRKSLGSPRCTRSIVKSIGLARPAQLSLVTGFLFLFPSPGLLSHTIANHRKPL